MLEQQSCKENKLAQNPYSPVTIHNNSVAHSVVDTVVCHVTGKDGSISLIAKNIFGAVPPEKKGLNCPVVPLSVSPISSKQEFLKP